MIRANIKLDDCNIPIEIYDVGFMIEISGILNKFPEKDFNDFVKESKIIKEVKLSFCRELNSKRIWINLELSFEFLLWIDNLSYYLEFVRGIDKLIKNQTNEIDEYRRRQMLG